MHKGFSQNCAKFPAPFHFGIRNFCTKSVNLQAYGNKKSSDHNGKCHCQWKWTPQVRQYQSSTPSLEDGIALKDTKKGDDLRYFRSCTSGILVSKTHLFCFRLLLRMLGSSSHLKKCPSCSSLCSTTTNSRIRNFFIVLGSMWRPFAEKRISPPPSTTVQQLLY